MLYGGIVAFRGVGSIVQFNPYTVAEVSNVVPLEVVELLVYSELLVYPLSQASMTNDTMHAQDDMRIHFDDEELA